MKSRSFQSCFFTDPFIQELTLKQRWLYQYYLYNTKTNWLGCYEITDKTVLYETDAGYSAKELQEAKDIFSKRGKILFTGTWVIVRNTEKYDNHLTNKQLMKTALTQYQELPKEIQKLFLSYKPKEVIDAYIEGFGSLGYEIDSSLLGSLPVAYELPTKHEVEVKVKVVKEELPKPEKSREYLTNIPDEDVIAFVRKFNCTSQQVRNKGEDFFNYVTSKGKKYDDYKSALRNALSKDYGYRPEPLPNEVQIEDPLEKKINERKAVLNG